MGSSKRSLDHLLFCRRFKETNITVLEFLLALIIISDASEAERRRLSRETVYILTPSSTFHSPIGETYILITNALINTSLFSQVKRKKGPDRLWSSIKIHEALTFSFFMGNHWKDF